MKLRWGTFCREIHASPLNPNDVSLVGLLSDFAIQGDESAVPPHLIPMSLWVYAVFDLLEAAEIPRNIKLMTRLDRPGREPLIKEIPIVLAPTSRYFSVNLQLNMASKKETCEFQEGQNIIRVSFRYKEHQLGKLELPIELKLAPVLETSNESDEKPED